MDNIYLSNFEILCSQGNLQNTLEAVKSNNIRIDKKRIVTDIQTLDAPYFLFKDEIKDDKNEIYSSLKELVSKIVSKIDQHELSSTGLIIGTALADLNLGFAINSDAQGDAYVSKKTSIDTYASKLVKHFGLNEFTMTINTACTSSANAILEASNLIQSNILNKVIVLGVEIHSKMLSSGFLAMNLITLDTQKPFEESRDGLVLGEAIAGLVLSKEASKYKLLGGYSNCNAASITGVSESGQEYVEVMQKALINSNQTVDSITAVKTHATSTPASDLSEMNAMDNIFSKKPPLCALKPYVGHTIGACGTLELSLFLSCIDNGFIPKLPSQNKHIECKGGIFMLNYFGFGGNNTTLIIKSEQE